MEPTGSPEQFTFDEKLLQRGLISSIEASERFNVTNDYVSYLCRHKKVRGFLLGRSWFVEEASLSQYLQEMKIARDAQRRWQL